MDKNITKESLIAELNKEKTRLYTLKTKKAIANCRELIADLERCLYGWVTQELDRYGNMSVIAMATHDSSDSVLVKTPIGNVWLDACNDIESKSWYNHTSCISYKEGDIVKIEMAPEVCEKTWRVVYRTVKHNGGTLDLEKYDRLCKDDKLAFFKYPTGMSGLFVQHIKKEI